MDTDHRNLHFHRKLTQGISVSSYYITHTLF